MKINLQKNTKTTPTDPRPTALRFSPWAWAKLLYLRDVGDTEIGGFGIAPRDDLLFVEDLQLVTQSCTWAHVEFDDEAVADFFDGQVDAGRRPEQFGRIWVHTHPGSSAEPSGTDEVTFARVFGRADWAVMFILARGGQNYARLRYNVGPGADIKLPIEIDYSRPFAGSNSDAWQAEYLAHVQVPPPDPPRKTATAEGPVSSGNHELFMEDWWRNTWSEYADFDRGEQEIPYDYTSDT